MFATSTWAFSSRTATFSGNDVKSVWVKENNQLVCAILSNFTLALGLNADVFIKKDFNVLNMATLEQMQWRLVNSCEVTSWHTIHCSPHNKLANDLRISE